jgi:acylphosphatase
VGECVRRRLLILGRVQGVYFRDSVRREAIGEGVSGSAHNRADGVVEVFLEGQVDAVERVICLCRTGPPQARVESVEISSEPLEHATGFVIS